MNHDKKKLLVILGPTATGKTDLAIDLAKKFNGEIVACDSRQVYVSLDIGSGKLPSGRWKVEDGGWKKGKGVWEIDGVKIWMYDVANPSVQYTVSDYVKDASKVIGDIRDKGKLPILVGGSGLYLRAMLNGMTNLKIPVNKKLRQHLSKLSLGQLQKKLLQISSDHYHSLNESDRKNPRRLLRHIEIIYMNPYDRKIQNSKFKVQSWDVLKIGLTALISKLREKINLRLKIRLEQGMIEEAKKLNAKGLSIKRMKELGLEYGVLAKYISGEIDRLQLVEKLQFKIGQYAKRQMTWFKKEKNVVWFDITTQNYYLKVEKLVLDWYNSSNDDFS